MARVEKIDFCDACYAPWYPRLIDADGEPMENVCDDCADLLGETPSGLADDDGRPPICSCGVTMIVDEDENGRTVFVCDNEECPNYLARDEESLDFRRMTMPYPQLRYLPRACL